MVERILGNRYLLKERIGIGGMASVYAAEDTTLNRLVAVKIMLPQYASDPSFAQRFRQEATAAAALQSPRIVSIHDWGCDGEDYFIVMELLAGSDMRALVRNEAPLDPHRIRDIGGQVCQALSVAHEGGTIHRDITPQNIMVLPDGNVKVMDFGIAKVAGSSMTQTSTVLGTAHYLSPEQAQGKTLTFASDLYSLGAVLYEAAAGQPIFNGPDPISVALQHVSADPTPLRVINPSIDVALEAVIMKSLAKDPAKRFQSAEAMRNALTGVDSLAESPTGEADSEIENDETIKQTIVLSAEQKPGVDDTKMLPRQIISPPNTTLTMPTLNSGKTLKVSTDAAPKSPKKKHRWSAAAVILAVGVILSAVAVYAIKPWIPANLADTGTASASVASHQETTKAANADQNSVENEEASDKQTGADAPQSENIQTDRAANSAPSREDLENFLIVEEAYRQVDHCNDVIRQAAEEFNAHYLDTLEQRQEYAQRASSIAQSISDQYAALTNLRMDVSLDFPWYNFFLDVQELYECLESRMNSIVEAWNISTTYESPDEHQSEILEPINRDRDESGNNRYLAHFNEIYPLITPPSLASSNATESHVENMFFSIDLPDAWIDRVTVTYEGSTVIVRPKEDTSEDGALFTAEIVDADTEETQGDIGGSMYYSSDNNIGKKVCCSVPNYPWFCTWKRQGGDSPIANFSDDLLATYVNLQTDGKQDSASLAGTSDESDFENWAFYYFESTIMPTVQMRQL